MAHLHFLTTPGRPSATGLTDFQNAIVRGSRHESSPDCGCRLGGLVASLALGGYLALAIALPRLGGTPVTFSWWNALAALLGGVLVGKTLGVLRARRRHARNSL